MSHIYERLRCFCVPITPFLPPFRPLLLELLKNWRVVVGVHTINVLGYHSSHEARSRMKSVGLLGMRDDLIRRCLFHPDSAPREKVSALSQVTLHPQLFEFGGVSFCYFGSRSFLTWVVSDFGINSSSFLALVLVFVFCFGIINSSFFASIAVHFFSLAVCRSLCMHLTKS